MIEVIAKDVNELIPYEKNPRNISEDAVAAVAESIQQFGFKNPILIDKKNVIVAGHTRRLAALKLGIQTVPCVVCDDLSPQEIRALRLADNKTSELSKWDFGKLDLELENLDDMDMERFGFDFEDGREFFERDNGGEGKQEGNDEYNEFVDKFKNKHTTDDCYTPEGVYEVVCDWVEKRYGLNRKDFVRPFYPNGDYKKFKYGKNSIVVDNPPFSILSEIKNFYNEKRIKYFLFAPHLTMFNCVDCDFIVVGYSVIYENGAKVNTSFITNLEQDNCIVVAPDLRKALKESQEKEDGLPEYEYPKNVIHSAGLGLLASRGVFFEIKKGQTHFIRQLDSQKKDGKTIFGSGFLIGDELAAELEKSVEAAKEAIRKKEKDTKVWELSKRERDIISKLNGVK